MSDRKTTIQSSNLKKGKPARCTFTCQLITIGNTKSYVLDNTKRNLLHMHFELTPDCKVEENTVQYLLHIQSMPSLPSPRTLSTKLSAFLFAFSNCWRRLFLAFFELNLRSLLILSLTIEKTVLLKVLTRLYICLKTDGSGIWKMPAWSNS